MKWLLALTFISSVQAVWFDADGNTISNADNDPFNSQVTWVIPDTAEAPYNGILNAFGIPGILIKTWEDDYLTDDTPAYIVQMAATSYLDQSFSDDLAKIILNMDLNLNWRDANPFVLFYTQAVFDNFPSVSGDSKAAYTFDQISFATMNDTNLAVVRLDAKVVDLLERNYTFVKIADRLPNKGDAITVSAALSTDLFDDPTAGTIHISEGTYQGALFSSKSDSSDLKSYNAFKMYANMALDGSIILNKDDELIGTALFIDSEYNIGNSVIDLGNCFTEDGWWNFTMTGCLKTWKRQIHDHYNFTLPGYEAPCTDDRCLDTVSSTRNGTTVGASALFSLTGVEYTEELPSDLAGSHASQTISSNMIMLVVSTSLAVLSFL